MSYRGDGGLSHHITARRNTVTNNRHGRSMSVVGGADVLYEHNSLRRSGQYACLYIAQEASYKTFGVERVVVRGNRWIRLDGNTVRGALRSMNLKGDGVTVGPPDAPKSR